MTAPVVAVSDLSFSYTGAPVLTDIAFSIESGEYVGIVGPNGSGKSTLLQLLLGLHPPDTGEIRLFDRPTRAFADRERVGYVAQDMTEQAMGMPITVAEVVLMGRFPHAGVRRIDEGDHHHTTDALARAGIADLANTRLSKLSGGQRQRAYIARALAGDADLLVLDEPTVGVDAESVEAFFDLLASLNRDGITILLVEHDIGAIIERTDRVLCVNRELYFDGDPAEFAQSKALERAYGTHLRIREET